VRVIDAEELLEKAASSLESGFPLSDTLRDYTVEALRCVARGLPLPKVQDTRGAKPKLDPYQTLREVCAEMERLGGTDTFHRAVEQVAGKRGTHEDTVRRALDALKEEDKSLELELIALNLPAE
jgi:hypothetical protein